MEVPQNGWFMMVCDGKSHLEMDDRGVPLFQETSSWATAVISWNHRFHCLGLKEIMGNQIVHGFVTKHWEFLGPRQVALKEDDLHTLVVKAQTRATKHPGDWQVPLLIYIYIYNIHTHT